MIFALDTDTASFALREVGRVTERITQCDPDEIVLPSLVVYEMRRGAAINRLSAATRRRIEAFIGDFRIADFDALAAEHAANIDADLSKKGTPIGTIDILIAGTARSRGLTLVTHNTREFGRVPSLKLDDWR